MLHAVLAASISEVLSELGYAGLALLMVAETVFPPIPSEVVLPLAGYLVQKGDFEFLPALAASTAGSLVGAIVLYEAARAGGRPFAQRFLTFAHQDPAKLAEAERWFQRRASARAAQTEEKLPCRPPPRRGDAGLLCETHRRTRIDAAMTRPEAASPMTDTMPYAHLGEALATDYFLVREQFSDEQWDLFIAHPPLRRPGGPARHQRLLGARRPALAAHHAGSPSWGSSARTSRVTAARA